MAEAHATRSHAAWSASASERNWNCPGAIKLIARLNPPDRESEAAAWGTACHEIVDAVLRAGEDDATAMIGDRIKTKDHEFEVDEAMAECAQVMINYAWDRVHEYRRDTGHADAKMLVEQKFTLASLNPPFQAGGTGDVVLLFPAWRMIEVIDLKTGVGHTVEVHGNKQLRTYALGALLANAGEWLEVQSTIVQPRKPHRDGPVRSETYRLADLFDWTAELLGAMDAAAQDDAPLKPGPHCDSTFCPARAQCPALRDNIVSLLPMLKDARPVPPDPDSLSMEEMVKVLSAADRVTNWLNAVRARAHALAEGGTEIPGYQLVEKKGRRAWSDEDEALDRLRPELGDEVYQPRKLRSPAQMEKALGAKRKALLAGLIVTPITGTNLVQCDRTERDAVPPIAERFFPANGE